MQSFTYKLNQKKVNFDPLHKIVLYFYGTPEISSTNLKGFDLPQSLSLFFPSFFFSCFFFSFHALKYLIGYPVDRAVMQIRSKKML